MLRAGANLVFPQGFLRDASDLEIVAPLASIAWIVDHAVRTGRAGGAAGETCVVGVFALLLLPACRGAFRGLVAVAKASLACCGVGGSVRRVVGGLSYSSPFLATTIVALVPPLAGPLAVFWYGRNESLGLATTRGMSRLLIAMMISALLEATAMTMFFVSLGGWHGYRLTQGLSLLLGDFTGPLMIVPVLIAARAVAPRLLRWRAVLGKHVPEMLFLLIPVLGLFWLQRIGTSSLLFDYSRVLLVCHCCTTHFASVGVALRSQRRR